MIEMVLDACTFQVMDSQGMIRGTGFAISSDLVITCAHVVKACNPTKGELFLVSYPERIKIKAEVLSEGLNLEKDVAFLRLTSFPYSSKHMGERLGTFGPETEIERKFCAFGSPRLGNDIKCLWAKGLIKGQIRNAYGDIQLQLESQDIAPGMSGAPVMDDKSGLIVGMVQQTNNPDQMGKFRDLAYALPMEALTKLRPGEFNINDISDLLSHQLITDPDPEYMNEELVRVLLTLYEDKRNQNQPVTRADLFCSLVRSRINMVSIAKQPQVIAMLDDFTSRLNAKPSAESFEVTDSVKDLLLKARIYTKEVSKDKLGVIQFMKILLEDSGNNIKKGLEKHDFTAEEILFEMKFRSLDIFSDDTP